MRIAFFDLDGTLLDGDTDVLWGELLTEQGAFSPETTEEFRRGYASGALDAEDFVARFLSPIKEHGESACLAWRDVLIRDRVIPALRPSAVERLEWHKARGDELVLATATNEFLTRPIADHLKIPHLLASPAERIDGKYTGEKSGPACFREQKLCYAEEWLEERGDSWEGIESWAYSDSLHDLPLLQAVTHPVAVSPDEKLKEHARAHSWGLIPK